MSNFNLSKGLWFVPLGGAGEIGMNLNLYGCDDHWIMVDLGVSFEDTAIPGVDVILPDPSFIEDRKDKLLGIILTHAHEDHLGAVPYLWTKFECPVYATPFAATFLGHKLKETALEDVVPVTEVPLSGGLDLGPFSIDFITLTHSIPEPNALAIRTDHGNVLHTGDWKFDDDPLIGEGTDFQALQEFGEEGVQALIGDSTNALTEGESGSEADVRESLSKLFSELTGRIAVGCFASNVARLESIAVAAEENGRHVALAGRSLWRMVDTAKKTGYLTDTAVFYEADEASYLPRDKVVYICTGSQGEPRAALTRIAFGQHPHVALEEGDTVVFSSRTIPGNEQSIFRLYNQFARDGVQVITSDDWFVHVSGHPARDEVRRMYQIVRPKTAIPVHGERRHLEAHAKLAKECQVSRALVIENGAAVKLGPEDPHVRGEVFTGRMALEGIEPLSYGDPVFKDRKRVAFNGSVLVSVVLNGEGLAAPPDLTVIGILPPGQATEQSLQMGVKKALGKLKPKELKQDGAIEDAVRSALRPVFKPTGRRPLTTVHITRI